MRVLHIVDEPYDSGVVHYALAAAAGLARRGHDARVWGLAGRHPVRQARLLGLPAEGYSRPWLRLPALRRALRALRSDLVVAHTGSAHTLALALAAGSAAAVVRTCGQVHSLKPRPGRRLLWGRTAGFVAANRSILREFERLYPGLPLRRAAVYEGSEDPGQHPPPAQGAVVVGIVGRLDPVKGHAVFLEAAAKVMRARGCGGVRFLVVGRPENVKAADLLRRAQDLAMAGRVDVVGHVPDALDAMRRCHAGVIASLGSEAVSRAAVEWMSIGRPLAATRVGCLPEYVENGVTGLLVPPADAQSLAEAVARLVRDGALRDSMGEAARRRYESLFTMRRFLDETERFYAEAAHAVPSR